MKRVLAVLILFVVAAFAWKRWSDSTTASATESKSTPLTHGSKAKADALPPSAVLKINPRMSSSAARSADGVAVKRGQLPAQVSPLMADYVAR